MAYPTGELTVDLHAIANNWRHINSKLAGAAQCGAVVKANAYGLGVDRVAPKIYRAGCRQFFVANVKEALQLRSLVGMDAEVFVLSGCNPGAETAFIERRIIPVIVSVEMLRRWAEVAKHYDDAEAALKVNSGMGRLGLEPAEFELLLRDQRAIFQQGKITTLMSHLACADTHNHPLNAIQLQRFQGYVQQLTRCGVSVRTSLANSAGVFFDSQTHCAIVRPGISLYGGNPGVEPNPMQQVVGLSLPVIQVRKLPAGEHIGYGATRSFAAERWIAVVSGGYADGIMRSLSNRGWGYLNGHKVPIVGRVSMDSTMFDVSDAVSVEGDVCSLREGDAIELLGANVSIDDLAGAAGTISYEILTSLGARYQRCYIE